MALCVHTDISKNSLTHETLHVQVISDLHTHVKEDFILLAMTERLLDACIQRATAVVAARSYA